MDLDSGNCQMIVPLERIAGFEPTASHRTVKHWVNHLAFNPGGTRFCFLHRFEIPEINHFGTRLFTADTNGTNLRCLWTGQVSHFDWFNNDSILAWILPSRSMTHTNRIKSSGLKILKRYDTLRAVLKKIPLIRSRFIGGRFALFNDGGRSTSIETIGEGILTEDGHCSYSPDRQWILMDLYPDISNHRTLLIYNDKSKTRIDIGKFHSPRKLRGEIRCDLHARWNRNGTQLCIDSAHEGVRQMYILDVTSIVKKLAQ